MTLNNDAKFEEKLTSRFKTDIRNLANFHQSTFKSLTMVTLMGSFCLKEKIYELKICRGVMCHDDEEWYKIWTEADVSIQNWHEVFDEFWPEHLKILLMQILKENWLTLSKMTWGI